ncbi:MAG: FmdB family zinc ribbon protein [Candidatus Latescibacterota bacterium]
MPIFEYVCQECHHQFEALVYGQRRVVCPQCEGTKLTKKLSSFAVVNQGPALRCEGDAPCAACCDGKGPESCPLN